MTLTPIGPWRLLATGAVSLALLAPFAVSAQSQLDVSDAEDFIGNWDLALQTEMGPFALDLDIEDQGGKVGASIGSVDLGGSQEITDITRSGDDLLLRYEMDAQGQVVRVSATLTREGEQLNVALDFADGMFMANGVATMADE